jgi:hypothetical protein
LDRFQKRKSTYTFRLSSSSIARRQAAYAFSTRRWMLSASSLKPLVEFDFDLARDFEQDGAFGAVMSPDQFFVARGILLERSRCFTNEETRQLIANQGAKSSRLIGATEV